LHKYNPYNNTEFSIYFLTWSTRKKVNKNKVNAHKLLPPAEINGRGMPMVGTKPMVMPILIDIWKNNTEAKE
jgi:hypothetical protein